MLRTESLSDDHGGGGGSRLRRQPSAWDIVPYTQTYRADSAMRNAAQSSSHAKLDIVHANSMHRAQTKRLEATKIGSSLGH